VFIGSAGVVQRSTWVDQPRWVGPRHRRDSAATLTRGAEDRA